MIPALPLPKAGIVSTFYHWAARAVNNTHGPLKVVLQKAQ